MLFTEWKLEEAQQVWLEEGIEIGIDKGREERELEIAQSMFADGDSIEKIARNTRIPLEKRNHKRISLPADENGNVIISKEKHPDIYDWAMNG